LTDANMSEKNENFTDLKHLLKLKRHEIPPPGYFNNFSGDVISRIRAGESAGGESLLEQLQARSAFWGNVLQIFSAKPGLIGALATSLCLLLLLGVALVDRSESGQAAAQGSLVAEGIPMPSDASPTLASAEPLGSPDGGITVSTNPVTSLQPVPTLFGSAQNPLFQPVNFMPANQ
jgi:hypothetical protein